MRASDDDRQVLIDQLRSHTADGRLSLEEFEVRVGTVYAARTLGELRAIVLDLPPVIEPHRRHRMVQMPTPVLIAALVLIGSVLLGHFAWWLIPIGFWIFGGCGQQRMPDASSRSREDVSVTLV
jgi:hypothetical protein